MAVSKSQNRREFLRITGSAAALLALGINPFDLSAKERVVKITILSTNDVHSRIEPFPMDGSRNQGMGGAARRAKMIGRIRSEEENVLLFDAGDVFQGTPYFNFFNGELEFKLMSEMGYDAGTIGNHDFDNGIQGFYDQLPNANFPILMSNYDLTNTQLKNKVQPYKIFNKKGIKIGVFGIGIQLDGLVPKALYGETVYLDPIEKANATALLLKKEMDCDLVICLSHLGYKYNDRKVSDQVLAKNSSHIDLIIGGHTHTFLNEPEKISNKEGKEVNVSQVGWAGINLGRIDYYFEAGKKNKTANGTSLLIDEFSSKS